MPKTTDHSGGDLFIVDNSDADWKVSQYLQEWTEIANAFDIATGYFEIGALLGLDSHWQKLDKIRVLMGDEVSRRTHDALMQGIQRVQRILDDSIEQTKEKNDFLVGVPAIVDALRSGQLECRVYTKDKFHAKAYITHAKHAVVGSTALVGSSNFTTPGLTQNVELNLQIRREVDLLQEWYERHWDLAKDITPDILKVIERHTFEYLPFEIYARALQQFVRGREIDVGAWEKTQSSLYNVLDVYQREGYQALMKIAHQYRGAFLCDGVGLGKTFIGLMVIERLVMFDRKRVALFVPKSGRKTVWDLHLKKYLPKIHGAYSNLMVLNHTDLLREDCQHDLERVKELADVIVIDEAHHFRNPGLKGDSRYWKMFELCQGKTVFMLTATPVNNRLTDLQHMVELFSQRQNDYFKSAPLGIHSLPGHFRKMDKALERIMMGNQPPEGELPLEVDLSEAEKVLSNDDLFRGLVVQRSRAYVKESQLKHNGRETIFPVREAPQVAEYSIQKTYGKLLDKVEAAFHKTKPLLTLAIYYPYAYRREPEPEQKDQDYAFEENRQKQIVALIRTQLLKRFESSVRAFDASCSSLLLKLLTWATKNCITASQKRGLQRWRDQHADLIDYVQQSQVDLFGEDGEAVEDDDIITEEMLAEVELLDEKTFQVDDILRETLLDMDQLAEFIRELQQFKPAHDDKLRALIKMLKDDPVLSKYKVLIFTEFTTTARYLRKELEAAGISGIEQVDGMKPHRENFIRRFAPYYNDFTTSKLAERGETESRILISTDVLSEGLNLQDATRLINYDLHWNPVRLMQRIGRVDRRLNPEVEKLLLKDHPEKAELRGRVSFWNFLPPDELNRLLKLYERVSHKTLRISKIFGIEGKKLLTPEDDYDALKEFNHEYEGEASSGEKIRLEWEDLKKKDPEIEERLNRLPGKVFSGKKHPSPDSQAVFFCFALPAPSGDVRASDGKNLTDWSEEDGVTAWYLFDLASEQIQDDAGAILDYIRTKRGTPRHHTIKIQTLTEIREKIESHIKNSYFKRVQAPIGVKASLKAWMELS